MGDTNAWHLRAVWGKGVAWVMCGSTTADPLVSE